MSRVTEEAVRAVFPKKPVEFNDEELEGEIGGVVESLAIATREGDIGTVCVWMVRLKELIEEKEGKPFDHGDHWAETLRSIKAIEGVKRPGESG